MPLNCESISINPDVSNNVKQHSPRSKTFQKSYSASKLSDSSLSLFGIFPIEQNNSTPAHPDSPRVLRERITIKLSQFETSPPEIGNIIHILQKGNIGRLDDRAIKKTRSNSMTSFHLLKNIQVKTSDKFLPRAVQRRKQLAREQRQHVSVTEIIPNEIEPRSAKQLLENVRKGLSVNDSELAGDGEGGTYLMKDKIGQNIAVFKPKDQEPFSPLNPKKYGKVQNVVPSDKLELKKGIRIGESAIRELAAYLLDHDGFAGVPLTLLVQCHGRNFDNQVGSLQKFESFDYESWDIGPSKFEKADVQKIAVLDLRIFNVDRHGGNILIKKLDDGKLKLIPIDHGFSLPDSLDGTDLWFEWSNWPQIRENLDESVLRYIMRIDVKYDAALLRSLSIREECVRNMVICTSLLKQATICGLNLYQTAELFYRKSNMKYSSLEYLSQRVPTDISTKNFYECLDLHIHKTLDNHFATLQKSNTKSQAPYLLNKQFVATHKKSHSLSGVHKFKEATEINDNYLCNIIDRNLVHQQVTCAK